MLMTKIGFFFGRFGGLVAILWALPNVGLDQESSHLAKKCREVRLSYGRLYQNGDAKVARDQAIFYFLFFLM